MELELKNVAELWHPAMFWVPETVVPSAWREHIPFAFWLTAMHRPRRFVELGTHAGASYFAFCQAIDRLSLDTTAYAVDTWQGDDHAGFYDENVFFGVTLLNDRRYAGFSTLLRSTFDEARQHFDDGQIDLLHIDGYHSYEAVKHDFEHWLPLLSDSAIVLFHDTNVRRENFGVYKFFEELSTQYRSFNFEHGNGLGVLAVGDSLNENMQRFFELAGNEDDAGHIRKVFARFGSYCTQSLIIADLEEHNARVSADIAESREKCRIMEERVGELDVYRKELEALVGIRDVEIAATRDSWENVSAELEAKRAEADKLLWAVENQKIESEAIQVDLAGEVEDVQEALKLSLSERKQFVKKFNESLEALKAEHERVRQDLLLALDNVSRDRDQFLEKELASTKPKLLSRIIARLRYGKPNPLFDSAWYLATNRDVLKKATDPWGHFMRYGSKEGRQPNAYFSTRWYLDRYPDVGASRIDPLNHYLSFGYSEGREPHPDFSTLEYFEANPDVAARGLNPLWHYLQFGRAEGRGKFASGRTAMVGPIMATEIAQPATNPSEIMFDETRRTFKLKPIKDLLKAEQNKGGLIWKLTGDDPQFCVDGVNEDRPIAGFYKFTFSSRSEISEFHEPKLYVDFGSGFSELEAIPLSLFRKGHDKFVFHVYFERPVRALRFDPSNKQGNLNLSEHMIATRIKGAGRLYSFSRRILKEKSPSELRKLVRDCVRIYRRRGLKALWREVIDYETGLLRSRSFNPSQATNYTNSFMQEHEQTSVDVRSISVGVHVHLYYFDLADEFARYLSRIPTKFSLYVSVPSVEGKLAAEKAFSLLNNLEKLDIRIVQNRGRDIAPFVVEFAKNLAEHDVISHIQSKKSFYNNGLTDGWREYLLGSLFSNTHSISHYVRDLHEGRYGIIYPQSFYNISYLANSWLANLGLAHSLAPRLKIGSIPSGYFDFPVGSMFWAKRDALLPILEAGFTLDDFPEETGHTDGTLAHCLERMFGVVPASRGYTLGIIRDTQWKSWSKWRLNQYLDRPIGSLYAMIESSKTKVVAFDIFDTLVVRPFLDPNYSKTALELEYAKAGISNFRRIREESEGVARVRKGADVSVYDIYKVVCERIPQLSYDEAVEREITMEIASVRPRREVISLLEYAVHKGKRVILASDMFLPRAVLERMMAACDIDGWATIYVSCDVNARKDNQRMYDLILEKEGIEKENMIMVGDNERSDFQIPADIGIGTIHVMRNAQLMRALPRLADVMPEDQVADSGKQFVFGAIGAELFSGISFPHFSADNFAGNSGYSMGYAILGPLVVAFASWLEERLLQEGIEDAYFLAREGKFLKEVCDLWCEGRLGNIKTHYLRVSRRAVSVPCIENIDDVFEIAASNNFYGNTMDVFLFERFGTQLSVAFWRKAELEGVWSRSDPVDITDGEIEHLKPFLRHSFEEILKQAQKERDSSLRFLAKQGLDGSKRAAVVDVGYSGTIQKFLMRLLGIKIDGLYMATSVKGRNVAEQFDVLVEGCFANGTTAQDNHRPILLNSFIIEKFLSADDTQVLHYADDGEEAILRPFNQEEAVAIPLRNTVQEGALDFVREAVRVRSEMLPELKISPELAEDIFARFSAQLSQSEREVISGIALDDFYCGRGVVS